MSHDIHQERILVLDFGSQYTQLIARRVRELGVFARSCPLISPKRKSSAGRRGALSYPGAESVTLEETPSPDVVFELRARARHLLWHANHGASAGGRGGALGRA